MKKIFSIPFSIAVFLLCFSPHVDAQKKLTEGKAIFDITYPESELDEQSLSMMPAQSTICFKGQFSRTEMKIAMGTAIGITDAKAGVTTTLMDMMGNKIAMKTTKEDLEKERKKSGEKKPEIKITNETKTIAGYLCKKAVITMKMKDSTETKINTWFTKDISAVNSLHSGGTDLSGLEGFMMEFQMQMNSLTMKMTCRSVEDVAISDSLFTLPQGYTLTTMEDLKGMMGGAH